jgi:acyl-CoA dehydrogenase
MGLTRADIQQRLHTFVREMVVPNEDLTRAKDTEWFESTTRKLAAQARDQGLYGPRLAPEHGGLGLSWVDCCWYFEEVGRSFLGPAALGCAAPGQPDIAALERLASPQQAQRYLLPLIQGRLRSCFAMTEPPPGAGSDPKMLSTVARRTSQGWVIDGHKWFISGAMRADIAIVVARAEEGVSWFLVETDNPGMRRLRDISTMEPFETGGHAEIVFDKCCVGTDAVLGEIGRGLEYSQWRLEGARLFHCMRFIGMASRAMEIAQAYALQRQSHGATLADHQMVQAMVADAHIDLYAARLMTRDVAQRLDAQTPIRHESSMLKVFVAEAVYRVADSAVQITGALGVSEDAPLSMILRMLRPFRIYDGASEVHRAAIAKRVFRHGINP